MKPEPRKSPQNLDELLGIDAAPTMDAAAKARLIERLAQARSGSGDTLDIVLGFDQVDPPEGLAERVIDRVRREQPVQASGELVPVPRRRWRPRLLPVALPLVGAAAALTLILIRGEPAADRSAEPTEVAEMTDEPIVEVSDDLLASLSVLEEMDFLTEELDPFEADALFLFETEDQVLMDLLVSEDYLLDGVIDATDGATDGSGDRR